MYKQVSFVITAAIVLTAFVAIALYTGSQTAHAAIIVLVLLIIIFLFTHR